MTSTELKQFLAKAKQKTYASKLSIPKRTEDKGKQYTVNIGELTYTDLYHGEKNFSGKEMVLLKGTPIWSMVYFGGTQDNSINENKVYGFLKSCLMNLPQEFPIRGPKEFSKGEFKYTNTWEGDLDNFKGEEKIYITGKLVYTLNYSGGNISF